MHPYFTIFGRVFSTYGLMAVTGGLLGFLPALFLGRRHRLDFENLVYLYAMGAVGAILGAVAFQFVFQAISAGAVNGGFTLGSMSLSGGMAGALFSFWYWSNKFLIPKEEDKLSHYACALIPSMPFVVMFMRAGCLCAGCCYGIEGTQNDALHIVFHDSLIAPNNTPLLATQPAAMLFHGASFLVLFVLGIKNLLTPKSVWCYTALFGACRFMIDFVRGDHGLHPFLIRKSALSTGQVMALALFVVSVFALARASLRKNRNPLQ